MKLETSVQGIKIVIPLGWNLQPKGKWKHGLIRAFQSEHLSQVVNIRSKLSVFQVLRFEGLSFSTR